VRDPRFQAELLLRHVLGCSRDSLLRRLQEPVAPEATGHFFQLVERRRGRVPIQYVIGSQEFFGLSFRVTPAVLIPRPETETLVEVALAELRRTERPRIADVGCGSGAIAVALAHALPEAGVVAVDVSPASLAIARENVLRHGVEDRIELREGDLLESFRDAELDAVVTNPPYIADEELAELEPEVIEHEPRQALSGGPDGLTVMARLLPQVSRTLSSGGGLFMEIGYGQATDVQALVDDAGLELLRTVPDLAGIPRVVVARKP